MWIVIPLIYLMSWRFCKSFRQAFQETVAWTAGYLGTLFVIYLLDIGGVDGVNATLDSPGVAIAMLGGFGAMWISHIRWKRRGGDPVGPPGKWSRAFGAIRGTNRKPAPRRPAPRSAPSQAVVGQPPTYGSKTVYDAVSSPVPGPSARPAPKPVVKSSTSGKLGRAFAAAMSGDAARPAATRTAPASSPVQPQSPQGLQQPASQQYSQTPVSQPQPSQSPPRASQPQKPRRKGDSGGKYAKATGRALGAMFRGSKGTKR